MPLDPGKQNTLFTTRPSLPDFRQVLFFKHTTVDDIPDKFTLHTSDLKGEVCIKVTGITKSGKLVVSTLKTEVK